MSEDHVRRTHWDIQSIIELELRQGDWKDHKSGVRS